MRKNSLTIPIFLAAAVLGTNASSTTLPDGDGYQCYNSTPTVQNVTIAGDNRRGTRSRHRLVKAATVMPAFEDTTTIELTGPAQSLLIGQPETTLTAVSAPEIFPAYHFNNYTILATYIDAEMQEVQAINEVRQNQIRSLAASIATRLATLQFAGSAFEIVNDSKVKFTLIFENDKSLRITKALNADGDFDNKIFYSYFEKKELVSANTNDLNVFIQGFGEYLSMES